MLRIALCDNDKSALPVIAGAAESAFKAQGISAEVTGFTSGKELLKAIDTVPFQMVLLDIDMPELDGIEVGKRLRSKNETVEIVYVSECENRVFESFSVFPLGFVRKSNFFNDIADIVRLYIRKYAKKQKADQLKFTTRSSVQVVKRKQIRYIEGCGNYQLVYINGQPDSLEIKMTMDKLEEMTESSWLYPHSQRLSGELSLYPENPVQSGYDERGYRSASGTKQGKRSEKQISCFAGQLICSYGDRSKQTY